MQYPSTQRAKLWRSDTKNNQKLASDFQEQTQPTNADELNSDVVKPDWAQFQEKEREMKECGVSASMNFVKKKTIKWINEWVIEREKELIFIFFKWFFVSLKYLFFHGYWGRKRKRSLRARGTASYTRKGPPTVQSLEFETPPFHGLASALFWLQFGNLACQL